MRCARAPPTGPQTLKRFLNGGALPDSDQAERISRALYIDRPKDRSSCHREYGRSIAAPIGRTEAPEPRTKGRKSPNYLPH